jgi:methionyl-tRNA formyltransferase
MRVIFMGSSAVSCLALERLVATPGIAVVAVVTQPDRPKGRSLTLSPSPVGALAASMGMVTHKFENVNSEEAVRTLTGYAPDAIAVVAYGQILKKGILGIPRLGCINLHGSLLPKYRGAAPCQWAVANGETVTGVTIIRMNERMDAGEMLLARAVDILPDDTGGTVLERIAVVGAEALCDAILGLAAGRVQGVAQDEAGATFARKLSKVDGEVDWGRPAAEVHNRVRGFHPWPGAWFRMSGADGGLTVKIIKSQVGDGVGVPGTVLAVDSDGVVVACGSGSVVLLNVQPEGRKAMGGGEFARGYRVTAGMRMGGV